MNQWIALLSNMYLSTVTCDAGPANTNSKGQAEVSLWLSPCCLSTTISCTDKLETKIAGRIEADWMQMISDDTRDRQESEIIWVICAKYNQLTTLAPLLPQLHFEGPTPPQSASVCRVAGLRSRPAAKGFDHTFSQCLVLFEVDKGVPNQNRPNQIFHDFSEKFGTMFLDAPG